MSLTPEAVSALHAKVEPRDPGVITQTGLLKTHDGTLITRPSTKYGFKSESETEEAMANDADRIAELQAMRDQADDQQEEAPKKRSRRRAVQPEPPKKPAEPVYRRVSIIMDGIGEIPSQYANANIGDGMALLGVIPQVSFIPKKTDPESDTPPNLLELSIAPGIKYVYLGNTVVLDNNIRQLVLIEVPEGE